MEYSREISKSVFNSETLLKAAYYFLDSGYFHFEENGNVWVVYVVPKNVDENGNDLLDRFENELVAQQVRDHVYRKTHTIRELLMARAFASTIVDNDDPLDRIKDDMNDISDAELEDILTDWFEKNEDN